MVRFVIRQIVMSAPIYNLSCDEALSKWTKTLGWVEVLNSKRNPSITNLSNCSRIIDLNFLPMESIYSVWPSKEQNTTWTVNKETFFQSSLHFLITLFGRDVQMKKRVTNVCHGERQTKRRGGKRRGEKRGGVTLNTHLWNFQKGIEW